METASLYLNVFILTISFVMSIFGLLFVVFGWCDPVDLFADLFSVTSFLAFFRSLVIIIMYVVCEVFKKRKMTYWLAVVMDVIMGIGVVYECNAVKIANAIKTDSYTGFTQKERASIR